MLTRVAIPSPNYSSRGGSGVRLIVLHTAEGALTYQALGNYFKSSSSGVSSHVGIDDTPNTVGEYVPRSGKAWTAANANPYSIQAELCAFAKWSSADWAVHPVMLSNTAAWIAEEAAYYGIPLVALTASQAQDGRTKGVCQHADLGSAGGGHWDCGSSFPMAQVLAMAAGGAAPAPAPPPQLFGNGAQEDGLVAICSHPDGQRLDIVCIGADREVWHYWTNEAGDFYSMSKENLFGTALSVSAAWKADGCFVVTVQGIDGLCYVNTSNPDTGWTGWGAIPDMYLYQEAS